MLLEYEMFLVLKPGYHSTQKLNYVRSYAGHAFLVNVLPKHFFKNFVQNLLKLHWLLLYYISCYFLIVMLVFPSQGSLNYAFTQ